MTRSGKKYLKLGSVLDVICALACSCHGANAPEKTEHGWKTSRVVATRLKNTAMGQFVELQFPQSRYDSDRVEISDYIESVGGWIFQGGGYPGAPAYVKFDGVDDAPSMDRKLLEILPDLDRLMADISAGRPIHIKKVKRKILDKKGREWPECVPPDPDDEFGQFNNNLTINGQPFKCSPEGKWVIDQKAVERKEEYSRRKSELLSALAARKMTHAELMEVNPSLNIVEMVPYSACEKYSDLYGVLVKQWELQTGTPMPLYVPLSKTLAEYGRCPQEYDNEEAVKKLISILQSMPGSPQ